MLNLVQHLTKSVDYETLKQVQGDKSGLFTRPSRLESGQWSVESGQIETIRVESGCDLVICGEG
jgi:hypothetical protein